MTLLQAIILGFIQGVSEFLPVSSSGHLLIFHHLFGITAEDNLTFLIVLNMGSLIPLLYVFRADLWVLIKNPFQKTTYLLIVATLPLVIATLLFEGFIESMFHSIQFLPIGFIITGIALTLSDRLKNTNRDIAGLKIIDAVIIGVIQACAVFPGISRSGSTITATMARGVNREEAAKFSFLMSIPAAFGAMAFRAFRIIGDPALLEGVNLVNLGAGFITSAVTGYFAITMMLTIIKQAKLKYFAFYYIFALAIIVFIL